MSAPDAAVRGAAGSGGRVLARRLWALWPWLPAVLGAAYLVLVLVHLGILIAIAYADADHASGPVIAELLGEAGPGRQVTLGALPWFSTLFFELATKPLPWHRQIWEGAPFLASLGAIALLAGAVRTVAGTWAASVTGAMLVAVSPYYVLRGRFAFDNHTTTWVTCAALGAWLVALSRGGRWATPRALVAMTVVLGLFVGVNAASDNLLLVAGIVPLVVAGVGLRWRGRQTFADPVVRAVLGVAVTAIAVAIATTVVMHANDIRNVPSVRFLRIDQFHGSLDALWQSIAVMGSGDFFDRPIDLDGLLRFGAGMLTVAAVVVPIVLGVRFVRRASFDGRSPATPRDTHVVYWGAAAVLTILAVLFSNVPSTLGSARYLVSLLLAAAATLPLIATTTTRRAVVTAWVSVIALAGLVQLAGFFKVPESPPPAANALQLEAIARDHGMKVGYAGYWDASVITWETHVRLRVYPVFPCPTGPAVCWSNVHRITTWYTPRPNTPTFLLVDSARTDSSPPPDPAFGPPTFTAQVGTVTMYGYDYDIASKLKPT